MQSNRWYSCALPRSLARANQYSCCGCNSAGHTGTHWVQRMQGSSRGLGGKSSADFASTQLVALTTGTSRAGTSKPIIGPPMMMPVMPSRSPACMTSSLIGVPISTSKFCGRSTWPVTVTMREISGSPCKMPRASA